MDSDHSCDLDAAQYVKPNVYKVDMHFLGFLIYFPSNCHVMTLGLAMGNRVFVHYFFDVCNELIEIRRIILDVSNPTRSRSEGARVSAAL